MKRFRVCVAFAVALLAGACGDSPTAPDAVVTTSVSQIAFEGVLESGAARFYSFSTAQAGSVQATLQSLVAVGRRDAVNVPVRLGVGVPRGEGCAVSESIETSPALVAQFSSSSLPTGTYCLNVADSGDLPGATRFLVRFSHP